ncbi:MAG: signal peptidase I [Candidatus Woesearchaeota archaeon]|jgi:signal peptidase I
MELKPALKKLWWFIWEDNSIWSWIVNLILAFILIKFIVYPGLGYLLGTGFPVVAVVSGSMEHDGSFDEWWESEAYCTIGCTQEQWYEEYDITKEQFQEYKFKNGFNKGDIMVLTGIETKNIKIGDVIVFNSNGEPIIHRVVKIGDTIQTKGDHNADSGGMDMNIQSQAVIGKAVFKIPLLGWIKIGFVELINIFMR